MKKGIVAGALVCVVLVALVAAAQTLFLSVTAPPYSEAAGTATVDGPVRIYLSINPMAEIHHPDSTVSVFEDGALIDSRPARQTDKELIATYSADARRTYTLVVQERDGNTINAQLFYD